MRPLRSRVRKHGTHQIECKTYYPFSEERRQRYTVVLYFFFPHKLNINKRHYDIQHILQDLTTFTRFSSLSMSIEELLNEENEMSPFVGIQRYVERIEAGDAVSLASLEHESKALVNAFRSAMRSRNIEIKKLDPDERIARITDYQSILAHFFYVMCELFERLMRILPDSATIIQWTEEALGIICIQYIGLLVQSKRLNGESPFIKDVFHSLLLDNQQRLRRLGGVVPLVEALHINKDYIYRCGELKRWSQSALYLEMQRRIPSLGSVHVMAGTAAAVAMIFSVTAALFAAQFFQVYSTPWILVIVISYIFKDRIKEVLRNILLRMFPKILTDRNIKLVDPGVGKKIGNSQTTVEHLEIRDLPEHIQTAWRRFHHPLSDAERQENVVRIKKRIGINTRKILTRHSRVHGLSEIIRIKTNEWRKEMSDRTDIHIFSGEEFIQKVLPKIYHVPFLLELRNKQNYEVQLKHFQILLDRDGIIDIQKISKPS